MENKKKKAFFLGTTQNPHTDNRTYSNFVFSLCLYTMKKCLMDYVDITTFKRHDMIKDAVNMKDSVFDCISNSDILIFLADQYDKSYNPNVWFELGVSAAFTEKTIVIISQHERLPFYLNEIVPVIVEKELIDWLESHKDFFKFNRLVTSITTIHDFDNEVEIVDCVEEFQNNLVAKIKREKNPFSTQIENADIKALGHGSIYDFVKTQISPSIAEFIPGERDAFIRLRDEIQMAKKSIRTTRLANQSIVTGKRENSDVQTDFMEALKEASKRTGLETFDRIIGNNNPKKWYDIFEVLLYCDDNARIFVRKSSYYIGFELVIIDEKISFIHFHNMSVAGDKNSNNTANTIYNQVVNSTLKIASKDVSEKLSKVFDRMHHRDFDIDNPMDLSRTLVGVPITCETTLPVRYQKCGVLCNKDIKMKLKEDDHSTLQMRRLEIYEYLYRAFESWYKGMQGQFEDKRNMALGISMLDFMVSSRILENFDVFFEDELRNGDDSMKKAVENLRSEIEATHDKYLF